MMGSYFWAQYEMLPYLNKFFVSWDINKDFDTAYFYNRNLNEIRFMEDIQDIQLFII